MADIVLVTLNVRYAHTAFGLRYLMANLGELQPRARLLEFDVTRDPVEIADEILRERPRIVGLGVYIWNVTQATALAALLKRLVPELVLVLGGPEVSHETHEQRIASFADHLITGEGDLVFAQLCRSVLTGDAPADRVIPAAPPSFAELALPYHLYTDEDLARRVVYVEASRGCPFTCEFCLSALDESVRYVPLEALLAALDALLARGATRFKFVDRTFNLNVRVAGAILEFFLARLRPALALHFEMIPDRFPEALRAIVRRFRAGCLQFEVGVQTLSPHVAPLISRPLDIARLEENLTFLRGETGVHVHADLIAGLPGESEQDFARGFDRLVALGPHEIQIELLKRLRGTPITRHESAHRLVFSPEPPYEILATGTIDFGAMRRLHRFARYWDLIANSGNFVGTLPLLWRQSSRGPYRAFAELSDWLYQRAGRNHALSLFTLMELFFRHLTEERQLDPVSVAHELWRDYQRGGRSDRPRFLLPFVGDLKPDRALPRSARGGERQARHRAAE